MHSGIWKARVNHNFDINKKGTISVDVEEWKGENPIDVVYVSPYYMNNQSGFIAVPGHGAEILIMGIQNSDQYYYAGSVVDHKEAPLDTDDPLPYLGTHVMPDEAAYSDNFTPEKVVIKTQKGHSLTLSDEWNKKINKMHIQLKTKRGLVLMMHDGHSAGGISLHNEAGDGLSIGSDDSASIPARGIMLRSELSQTYQTRRGSIDILVNNGGELNIENNSNGKHSLPPFFHQSGCINIASKHRDINITNKAIRDLVDDKVTKPGRVMIHAGHGLQLECTEGEVIIHSAKKISIASEGDIDMQSRSGDINLHALDGEVNIKAGTNLNLEGTAMAQMHSEIIKINMAAKEGMWSPIPGSGALLVKPLPTSPAAAALPSFIQPDSNGDPYIQDPGI